MVIVLKTADWPHFSDSNVRFHPNLPRQLSTQSRHLGTPPSTQTEGLQVVAKPFVLFGAFQLGIGVAEDNSGTQRKAAQRQQLKKRCGATFDDVTIAIIAAAAAQIHFRHSPNYPSQSWEGTHFAQYQESARVCERDFARLRDLPDCCHGARTGRAGGNRGCCCS